MKKIYIALAVLATAALNSCTQEKSFNGVPVSENDIAFVMQASPSTRSAEFNNPVTKGINVPIGELEGNLTLFLEETITDLNCVTAETRSTPVFTENVGKLYKDKLFVHANGFGDATFETMDNATVDGGWRYNHNYGSNKWPTDGSSVDFFLRMPSDLTLSSVTYAEGAKTTFTYTSPTTAEAQDDIIFAGITLDEATHKSNLPNGTPVTFYHALTAVKFAIANTEKELNNIQVTNISFTGLKNTGTCTVDPTATTKVTWDNTSATTTTEGEGEEAITKANVIQQDFVAGDLVEFSTTANPDFGTSFFNTNTDTQNINTQTASKTFWLVPQSFANSSAVLRITYIINEKEEYMDIALGDLFKTVEWKAGQLRTYIFRIAEVNVKIEDKVSISGPTQQSVTPDWADEGETFSIDSYEGSTKTNVKIYNTGNTPAFIRAAIIGQWRDANGDPVFGFTDFTHGIQLVDSWYQDQFVNNTFRHGHFTNLPGCSYDDTPADDHNWIKGSDGYYYYKKVVPVGGVIQGDDALFESYTVGKVPGVAIAGESAVTLYFTLEIATQAISANKLDGTTWADADYATVWQNAINQQ